MVNSSSNSNKSPAKGKVRKEPIGSRSNNQLSPSSEELDMGMQMKMETDLDGGQSQTDIPKEKAEEDISETDPLLRVARKNVILTFTAVLTTFINLFLYSLWKQIIFIRIDQMINGTCLILTFKSYVKEYSRVCGPLDACVASKSRKG